MFRALLAMLVFNLVCGQSWAQGTFQFSEPNWKAQRQAIEASIAKAAECIKRLKPKAEAGDVHAQFEYGQALIGNGICRGPMLPGTENYADAIRWYRNAAEQGNTDAQFELGSLFEQGEDVKRDDQEAAHWFQKAAEKGDIRGQYRLARMYEEGRGVRKSLPTAAKWYRAAAEEGHLHSQYATAFFLEKGLGTNSDLVEALVWYEIASKRETNFVAKLAATRRDYLAARLSPASLFMVLERAATLESKSRKQK